METNLLIQTTYFSQHEIIMEPGNVAEQESLEIDQTFFILNGVGLIETPEKTYSLKCRGFIHLPKNTPYKIINTERTLLRMILTQSIQSD